MKHAERVRKAFAEHLEEYGLTFQHYEKKRNQSFKVKAKMREAAIAFLCKVPHMDEKWLGEVTGVGRFYFMHAKNSE